jgi:poly(3-hydroxybutyrate) depolymerase
MASASYRDFEQHELQVGGRRRSYLLFRPQTPANRALPVVLALH